MRESKKSEGGAFKAPPGSYRVKNMNRIQSCQCFTHHNLKVQSEVLEPVMIHIKTTTLMKFNLFVVRSKLCYFYILGGSADSCTIDCLC